MRSHTFDEIEREVRRLISYSKSATKLLELIKQYGDDCYSEGESNGYDVAKEEAED